MDLSPAPGAAVLPRWSGLAWFLSVALLHGWWSEWANLGGYGQRFIVDALPVLALGFAWLAQLPRRPRAWAYGLSLAAAAFGYGLFLAAIGGLVPAPPPYPWPLRLSDYAVLAGHSPAGGVGGMGGTGGSGGSGRCAMVSDARGRIGGVLCRASFSLRAVVPACRR